MLTILKLALLGIETSVADSLAFIVFCRISEGLPYIGGHRKLGGRLTFYCRTTTIVYSM